MQLFNIISHPILNKYIQPIHKNKIIYLDVQSISTKDAILIFESTKHWEQKTKGLVKFSFKINPTNKDLLFANENEAVVIAAVSEEDWRVKDINLKKKRGVLAFFTTRYSLPAIIIIPERIENDENYYRSVIIHELGHAIGLDHNNIKNSIMYPYAGEDGPYFLTQDDMNQFCLKYFCDPNKLKNQ